MRRTLWALALILAVGIAAGVAGNRALNAQQQPVKRTVLQKADLGDKEEIMFLGEIAPGAAAAKHYHPGHEFLYIVSGSMTLEIEGKPPVTLKAGDSYQQPAKQVHRAVNASKSEPLKVLAVVLAEKGQPVAIDVK